MPKTRRDVADLTKVNGRGKSSDKARVMWPKSRSPAVARPAHQGADEVTSWKAAVGNPFPKREKHMNGIMAYCGLLCQTCPIYLATRKKNREEQARMRAEIAQLCKEQYSMNYVPEDITDCDGCRTEEGRLFSACKNCSIRGCAKQKGLENCVYCSEYACERLEAFFVTESAAKTRLDAMRSNIQ
jgi:hypothetical protein